jgi:hypothetical protein
MVEGDLAVFAAHVRADLVPEAPCIDFPEALIECDRGCS